MDELLFAPMRSHPQAQCLLFNKLPGEIRNYIFELALAQYEDKSKPYPEDSYYYRPGFTCEHRIDTELLRTCHRIYTEARHLPVQAATAVVWFDGADRRPPGQDNLVTVNRAQKYAAAGVDSVHVFAQMYWLEWDNLCPWFGADPGKDLTPKISIDSLKHLRVTIRHTDWWFWEQCEPLRINSPWLEYYIAPASLQDFKLELEVPTRKEMELDTLINSLVRHWTFFGPNENDNQSTAQARTIFSTKNSVPTVDHWTGSAVFDGENYEPSPPKPVTSAPPSSEVHLAAEEPPQPLTIDYVVVTLTWLPYKEEPASFTWEPVRGGLKWGPVGSS